MQRLSDIDTERFAIRPEAGMGFQFVHVMGSSRYYLLFNATIAINIEGLYDLETMHALAALDRDGQIEKLPMLPQEEADKLDLSENVEMYLFMRSGLRHPLVREHFLGHIHGSPALASSTSTSSGFVRYSAYQNDRRMTSSGVTPGTYVTSLRDAHEVPSGLAAVGRYALPNPKPAIYRFDLDVPSGVAFRYGSVMPAFGRAGGGVEVEFPNGVAGGSVSRATIDEF